MPPCLSPAHLAVGTRPPPRARYVSVRPLAASRRAAAEAARRSPNHHPCLQERHPRPPRSLHVCHMRATIDVAAPAQHRSSPSARAVVPADARSCPRDRWGPVHDSAAGGTQPRGPPIRAVGSDAVPHPQSCNRRRPAAARRRRVSTRYRCTPRVRPKSRTSTRPPGRRAPRLTLDQHSKRQAHATPPLSRREVEQPAPPRARLHLRLVR